MWSNSFDGVLRKLRDLRHGGGSLGDLARLIEKIEESYPENAEIREVLVDWSETFSPWELRSDEERILLLRFFLKWNVGRTSLWLRFLKENPKMYYESLREDRFAQELYSASFEELITLLVCTVDSSFADPGVLEGLEKKGWISNREVTDCGTEVLSYYDGIQDQ